MTRTRLIALVAYLVLMTTVVAAIAPSNGYVVFGLLAVVLLTASWIDPVAFGWRDRQGDQRQR